MPHFGYTLRIALVIVAVSLTLTAGIAGPARPRVACTPITNVNQLQAMRNNLAGNYCLANDIDASTKPNFAPVGRLRRRLQAGSMVRDTSSAISGSGVRSLASACSASRVVPPSTISHFRTSTSKASRTTRWSAALPASPSPTTGPSTIIANVRVSGRVICTGDSCDVGGIVGGFGQSTGAHTIRNSSSSADVTGTRFIGGIVGFSTTPGSVEVMRPAPSYAPKSPAWPAAWWGGPKAAR